MITTTAEKVGIRKMYTRICYYIRISKTGF